MEKSCLRCLQEACLEDRLQGCRYPHCTPPTLAWRCHQLSVIQSHVVHKFVYKRLKRCEIKGNAWFCTNPLTLQPMLRSRLMCTFNSWFSSAMYFSVVVPLCGLVSYHYQISPYLGTWAIRTHLATETSETLVIEANLLHHQIKSTDLSRKKIIVSRILEHDLRESDEYLESNWLIYPFLGCLILHQHNYIYGNLESSNRCARGIRVFL